VKRRTARVTTILGALVSAAALAAWGVSSSAQGASRSLGSGVVVIESNLAYQGGQGAGTGMVLSSSGRILTNNHVIQGATTIRVIVPGTDRSYSAKVVGYSASDDVALIQASGASGLETITPGNSGAVNVGDAVTALGNAGGTGSLTPAPGHVTGLDRTITASDETGADSEQLSGLIETDANVQPGDSGGPLLDGSGHVIGMDSAASTGSQFAFGDGQSGGADGYAIPIAHALAIVKQIESGRGSSSVHVGGTAFLGVQVEAAATSSGYGGDQSGNGYGYDPNGGSGYGYDPNGGSGYGYDPYGDGSQSSSSGDGSQGSSSGATQAGGAVIAGTVQGGPADNAGLAQGDTITAVDGHTIDSPDALTTLLQTKRPGAMVSVAYVDQNGASQSVDVTLGSGPAK
jgi:S1-C subfamily serine protease